MPLGTAVPLWYNNHIYHFQRGASLLGHKALSLGLFVLLLFSLIACHKEPEPVATETPALSPIDIAENAAEAMLSIESLHFAVERDGALAYIDATQLFAFKRAEGDSELPDQMRAIVRVITAFTPIDIGMVVIGDDQYATDPITGEWGEMPAEWGQFSLLTLFDPETGLQRLLKDGILDLSLVGSEEIEQQRHYHLTGRASGERMSAMTLGFIGHGDVDLDVWIGTEDFYVRRLYIVEPETDPDDPTTWTMTFSELGQPVEINAPPISSYYPAPVYVKNGKAQMVFPHQW
jgi:lipoprotein LprG